MHPNLEALLSFRDGEASEEVSRHVESCPSCQREVEGLRETRRALAGLPPLAPPAGLWTAVREEMSSRKTAALWIRWGIAASFALLAVSLAVLIPTSRKVPVQPAQPVPRPQLADLIRRSQDLERVLDGMDARPVVLDGRRALAGSVLEDHLALVDEGISQAQVSKAAPEEQARLWGQRVKLLGALVETRSQKVRTASI